MVSTMTPQLLKTHRANIIFHFKILISYRELLVNWVMREVRVRYKQSFLGVAWAILQPLSMMLIFTVVFSLFARIPSEGLPYPIFCYAALLPWTFFATSVSFGVPSVVNQMDLVTKIYFPREILPLSSVIAAFFDFLVASTVFIGLILFYKVQLSIQIVWLPLLLSIQVLLTLGIVLLASAINVFYRDIRFIIPLITQLWMFASPVIYPVSSVPEWLRPFYLLNPMAPILDGYRRVVLLGTIPDLKYLTISACVASILFVTGYYYFKRVELSFADLI